LYEKYVPLADTIYDEHIAQLKKERVKTDG